MSWDERSEAFTFPKNDTGNIVQPFVNVSNEFGPFVPTQETQELYNRWRDAQQLEQATDNAVKLQRNDNTRGKTKVLARRSRPLSMAVKARAAFVRHIGSCSQCKLRKVKCDHHDLRLFEKAYEDRRSAGVFRHPMISRDNIAGSGLRLVDHLVHEPPSLVGSSMHHNVSGLALPPLVAIGIYSTISKDNTAGEETRRAGLLAHLGAKTRHCVNKVPQQVIEEVESPTNPSWPEEDQFERETIILESEEVQAQRQRLIDRFGTFSGKRRTEVFYPEEGRYKWI